MENGSESPLDLVVGIAIRGGQAYFAAVEGRDTFLASDPLDRITPSQHTDRPEALGDFRDRVAQELRRIQPRAVGVAYTRKYKNWSADQAFRRFSLDTAAMIAAVDLGIPCQQVREEDAARAVGAPPAKLSELAAERPSIGETNYWNDRVWAIATALHVAQAGTP